jgi:hypothetical protein
MPTPQARELAYTLLHAADLAEAEAFIFEFHAGLTGDVMSGGYTLQRFRDWRAERTAEIE